MSDVSLDVSEGEGLRRPYSIYEMPNFHRHITSTKGSRETIFMMPNFFYIPLDAIWP